MSDDVPLSSLTPGILGNAHPLDKHVNALNAMQRRHSRTSSFKQHSKAPADS